MRHVIGIDLGTTNTVAAVSGGALHGSDGDVVLPSVVAFPPSGATLVGGMAKKRRAIDPKNTVFSAKRLMGQGWHSYAATQFRKQYPFDLVETASNLCAFKTRAGTFSPSDIGSYVVGKVLSMHKLDPIQCDAVIAIPASFDQAAHAATVQAAEQAGLRSVSTIPEPVATALAYLARAKVRHRRVAVYDFGGGTFDLAVVDTAATPTRVIAHGGDAYLGGDDIDKALTDWAAQQTLQRHKWDLRSDAETLDRLMVQAERCKVRLSLATQTRIELSQVDPGAPAAPEGILLDRDTLRRLAEPFISRTFLICDQVLRDASLRASDIDAVFLAGGTTLLPAVRESVARYFGAPVHAELDPIEVVSVGASVAGHSTS
jgi:molecular chaperone DnaK